MLHGLATATVHAMEPWLPPAQPRSSVVRAWCSPSDLRLRAFVAIFVDAALDIFRYRAGAFIPKMSTVRSDVIPDLKNTFWSFVPPLKAEKAFRFGFRLGGGACVLYRMRRMPFGWKYSPLVC